MSQLTLTLLSIFIICILFAAGRLLFKNLSKYIVGNQEYDLNDLKSKYDSDQTSYDDLFPNKNKKKRTVQERTWFKRLFNKNKDELNEEAIRNTPDGEEVFDNDWNAKEQTKMFMRDLNQINKNQYSKSINDLDDYDKYYQTMEPRRASGLFRTPIHAKRIAKIITQKAHNAVERKHNQRID